jgi:TonB family protein
LSGEGQVTIDADMIKPTPRSFTRSPLEHAARLLCRAMPLITLSSAVFAQSATLEMPRDATPLTIVTPAFPPAATAPPGGVRVDVTGTVRADGTFHPQAITAEGDPAPFIGAVADVVGWWRFLPAVDIDRCAPKDAPSQLSIWFEGSAAEPRIFVSQPPAQPKVEPPPFESIWGPKLSYTGTVEGQVRVLLLLSTDGRVKSAQVRSSSPPGYFDAAVLRAARRTIVTWRAPGPTRDVCAVREYVMCLGPGPDVTARHPACSAPR